MKRRFIESVAAALHAAAAEHGWEGNTFAPSELHAHHGGPSPMVCGRVGRGYVDTLTEIVGAPVTYEDGRFRILAEPADLPLRAS